MYRMNGRRAKVLGAVFVLPMGLISTGGAALAATPSTALRSLDAGAQSSRPFTAHVILSGSTLSHTYTPQGGDPGHRGAQRPRRHHPARGRHLRGVPKRRWPSRTSQHRRQPRQHRRRVEDERRPRRPMGRPGQDRRRNGRPPDGRRHRHRQRGRQLEPLHDRPDRSGRRPSDALQLQRATTSLRRHRRHLYLPWADLDQCVGPGHDRGRRPAEDLPGRLLSCPRRGRQYRHGHAAVFR